MNYGRECYEKAISLGLTDLEFELAEQIMADPNMSPQRAYLVLKPNVTDKYAATKASRIIGKDRVCTYFQWRLEQRANSRIVTQEEVLMSLKMIATRCMQSEPVIGRGGEETGEYKFDAQAAISAWKLLGSHLGMWKEKYEISGPDGGPVRVIDEGMSNKEATIIYEEKLRSNKGSVYLAPSTDSEARESNGSNT